MESKARELFFDGNRHLSEGDDLKAEACFREALKHAPDFAEAHTNLGMLLDQRGMPDEAEHHYLRSLALDPAHGETHMNLGALLAGRKRFDEAEAAYRKALEQMPDSPAVWSNLGALQAFRKQEREAERSYRRAIELAPDNWSAYFNLSYLLLRQGRFEEGWSCLEKRRWYVRLEESLPCPRWQGEQLEGRTLLIGLEAGHGDMIQFCRYAAVLKARGASRIEIVCHPALKTLFSTLKGADAVFAADEDFVTRGWDFWTPPLSMPYYCRTRLDSIPGDIPYLRADGELSEKWSSVLSGECGPDDLRVGLVWKGNSRFENDADRSLPGLSTLEPLGTVPGVRFFSLQKGAGEDEAANPPPGLPVVNLGPQLSDFADTAAVAANLDLIISVDTATAHLAGALGRDCWVLLPDYMTDWRWLTGRSDSPWYPSVMRLFRQPRMGDWTPAVAGVREALLELASTPGRDRTLRTYTAP